MLSPRGGIGAFSGKVEAGFPSENATNEKAREQLYITDR
jgi:hypothetical protein